MVIVGILIWCVGIPVASVMRHRPEQYGSYRFAFSTFALCNLLAVVAILLAKRPIPKSAATEPEPQLISG